MRKIFLLLLTLTFMSGSISFAATSHPTPKPTAKAQAKAPVKTPAKPATKTPTKKPVKKVIAKKSASTSKRSTYRRPAPRKRVRVEVSPSASPKWPPVNFQVNKSGDSYAKILKNEELIGLASASKSLTAQLAPCATNACSAVIVASEKVCTWWDIRSNVTGIDPSDSTKRVTLGALRTLAKGGASESYSTILLISTQAVAPGVRIENINANCMTSVPTESIPSNIYTVAATS